MSAALQPPKTKPFYLRDLSAGMNLSTSRESIQDNEAWWIEGLQPVGPGNLMVMKHPSASGASVTESQAPTYSLPFQVNGTSFIFTVFSSSGNGYIGQPGGAQTKVFNGTLTSGKTCAAQWNKLGILIVDTAGYWDWGVTTANTLSSIDHSVQSVTVTDPGSAYTITPTVSFSGGGGSGATATAFLGVARATIAAGGAGYKADDVLLITDFSMASAAQIRVDTVDAAGAVTALTIIDPGRYQASPTGATTGGAGNGANLTLTYNVVAVTVTSGGNGYTSAPAVTFTAAPAPTRVATATAQVSGSLAGSSIATFAGRAWIGNGRTVTFTDAGSYKSFVGSGSEFTIDDAYLIADITALFAANNYLYIFGDTSVDVLSNVTVTAAGTASFSRVNVSPVIGCSRQQNIFAYYRSIAFANPNGFFMLTGATVENISEGKLDLFLPGIVPSRVFGFPVTLNNQLCAAWTLTADDNFIVPGSSVDVAVIYCKGRWWFSRHATGAATFIFPRASVAVGSISLGFLAYAWNTSGSTSTQYQLFASSAVQSWRLYTKIYDLGSPMMSKQLTRAAYGVFTSGGPALGTGLALSVDTEYGIGTAMTVQSGATGYRALFGTVGVPNNSRYIGFGQSFSGTDSKVARLEWMATEYTETNSWQ